MNLPLPVAYFDGRTARRHPARLDLVGSQWRVCGNFGERLGGVSELSVSEPLGHAPRTLHWPDGAYCEIADHAGFEALLARAGHRVSPVVMVQGRLRWAVMAVAALITIVVTAYLYVLPWGAEVLARRLPDALAQRLSATVLVTLDEHVLAPSQLPAARQEAIVHAAGRLRAGGVDLPAHRIHFRAAEHLPANAFALPSGDIVVFDALVSLADSDDEVVAVIAHELGHVVHRHGLRQMLQSTVVSAVVAVYLGDVSSLATGFGSLLLESRYSRAFESEADRYGATLLHAAGMSSEPLARMLEKLAGTRSGSSESSESRASLSALGGLLATHPDTPARVEALRGLAR